MRAASWREELSVTAGEHGSAEQNIALHKAVMQKLAENGGIVPARPARLSRRRFECRGPGGRLPPFRPARYRAPAMSVNIDKVRHIAKLARIAMSEDELERLVPELNNILGWIEQLGEVDTDGVEPLTAVIDQKLRLRDDVVERRQVPRRGARQRAGCAARFFRGAQGDRVIASS